MAALGVKPCFGAIVPALLFAAPASGRCQDTLLTRRITRGEMTLEFASVDSMIAKELAGTLASGRSVIERFFGGTYRTAFTVRIYPNRAALTAHWAQAWKVPDLRGRCGARVGSVGGRA